MKYFIAYWCSEGFEYLADITDHQYWEANNTALVLAGQAPDSHNKLSAKIVAMKLRAQFNQQRNYELYTFTATDSIQEHDLKEWAERDPQSLVEWIRENGLAIVKRATATKQVIQ